MEAREFEFAAPCVSSKANLSGADCTYGYGRYSTYVSASANVKPQILLAASQSPTKLHHLVTIYDGGCSFFNFMYCGEDEAILPLYTSPATDRWRIISCQEFV